MIEILKKADRIRLKDAARMLKISVITIRRSLHQEDEPLSLALLGGYVVMVHKPTSSMPVIQDVLRNRRGDLPIATLIAGMVNENDLIFFDSGRGISLIISVIPDAVTLISICYSHRVFVALNKKLGATAIFRGSTYRTRSDTFCDVGNSSPLDSLNPREIFISASGVRDHFGVSWFNPEDLVTKRRAMARGLRKILLTCHVLFDEVASASLTPLSAFGVLISDRPLPADYVTYCRNASVKVIAPDPEDE